MSSRACCAAGARTAGLVRRGVRAVPWLTAAVLLLTPKCPVCFAAWFSLASGVGISATTASGLRGGLAALCAGSLAFAIVAFVRRRAKR